jgi:hypothetical protein
METNPKKTLHQLAFESGVSKLSIHWAAKSLKLHPYEITVMQHLYPVGWEARRRYCKWFQESVAYEFLDLELIFLLVETWLNGSVIGENNRYGILKIPMQFFMESFHVTVKSRLVFSESEQNNRACISQRNTK